MSANWYDASRVSQPGSTILNEWRAEREAQRSKVTNAATPLSEAVPGTDMYELLTGGAALGGTGIPVTEATAMAIGAVYACIGILGGSIASLPFHIYKRNGKARERYDSDLWYLFNEQPDDCWTAASAWSYAVQSICLEGDAYWRIRRVTPYTNTIEGFEPYHPRRVFCFREKRRNYYTLVNEDGTIETIDQADMLHFPGLGFNGIRSISPLRAALRSAGGIALAADQYAASFFRNGARPDFALQTEKALTDEAANILRNTWSARHSGVENAHLPAVLTNGLKVQQLTMSAEDAQLLATRKFQVEDISRIYGVPLHMINATEKSTSWGSGIEQMSIGFVRYTLRRYLDSMAQEINRKIWPKSNLFFGEHNTDALMDGDSATQAAYFAKALGGPGNQGWMAVEEVRNLKNLPPEDADWAKHVQPASNQSNKSENGNASSAQASGQQS